MCTHEWLSGFIPIDNLSIIYRISQYVMHYCIRRYLRGLSNIENGVTSVYVGFCLWLASAYGWRLSTVGFCQWLASVCGWLLPMVGFCLWLASVYGWFLTMVGFCLWLPSVYSWLLSMVGFCLWSSWLHHTYSRILLSIKHVCIQLYITYYICI